MCHKTQTKKKKETDFHTEHLCFFITRAWSREQNSYIKSIERNNPVEVLQTLVY